MDYIKASLAAEKWNMSKRRVQDLCKLGRVPGAMRFGTNWMIPADAVRPADGRRKTSKTDFKAHVPLVRKTPFLDMTDLYSVPGTAEAVIESLSNRPEAQALFSAEIAYSRGEIDKVYEYANAFLESHSGFYAIISGGMLLSLCAMWKGDYNMWLKAKKHICEAPCTDSDHADIIELALAVDNTAIRISGEYPEWFTRGCFEKLPKDSHPAARMHYIKYLLILAQDLATGRVKLEGIQGMGLMRMIPYITEPMITQMHNENIVMAEIYLRLLAAVAYSQTGENKWAAEHIDRAIDLCLPDKLYGPLVEHRRQLGMLLDDRLALKSPEALKRVKELHKVLHDGWARLHNTAVNRTVSTSLSAREREVARLAAYGMTDAQISKQLFISESSVKSLIRAAKNKTGAEKRSQFVEFI